MKISDVIKKLEELYAEHGDCEVEVLFRDDDCGDYCGSEDPGFWFNEERNTLLL